MWGRVWVFDGTPLVTCSRCTFFVHGEVVHVHVGSLTSECTQTRALGQGLESVVCGCRCGCVAGTHTLYMYMYMLCVMFMKYMYVYMYTDT